MEEQKTVLIISDGAESTQKIASSISVGFSTPLFAGYQAAVLSADAFSGVDLLPASVFFLGCEKPGPCCFLYIEDLFRHINLAGRPCGVFSSRRRSLKYLSNLVKDSEVALGKPLLAKKGMVEPPVLEKWIQDILEKR